MPSVRSLATELGLGVNTVRAAYHILEHEGLIISRPKIGTQVARGVNSSYPSLQENNSIQSRFSQLALDALAAGYEASSIKTMMENALEIALSTPASRSLVFVECTAFDAERLASQASRMLGLAVRPVVLADLRSWLDSQPAARNTYLGVITTFFHYAEVKEVVRGLPAFGVVVELSQKALGDIRIIPRGSRIAVVCHPEASMQYFLSQAESLTSSQCEIRHAFATETAKLQELFSWADVFFVSNPCLAMVEREVPKERIFLFYDQVSEQSLAMLKEHLKSPVSS